MKTSGRINLRALVAFAAAAFVGAGCTETKMAAPSPRAAQSPLSPLPPTTPSTPYTPQPPAPPVVPAVPANPVNCDPNKDFAQLDFPPEISTCLSSGKLYNFDASICTPMTKATFECSFAGVKNELANLELSASPLDTNQAQGAKLISCGVSNDGYTIVTQFFFRNPGANTSDCKFSNQGHVTSVCFRKFVDTPPMVPVSDADKKAYVAQCMQDALN